jgi:hypothetical protein
LAISILAHALLLSPMQTEWGKPLREIAFPIEASLIEPTPPAATANVVAAPPAAMVQAPAAVPELLPANRPETIPPNPPSQSALPPEPEASKAPESTALQAPDQTPAVETAPSPAVIARPEPASTVAPAMRLAVRTLPSDLTLIYKVSSSEGGQPFEVGRATYVWHSRDGRYTLTSKAEPTGVAALFLKDNIAQTSAGAIDAGGLRPTRFSQQKGDRKPDIAIFDWESSQVTLNGQTRVLLTTQAQDLLGFPFHLALTVREDEPDFMLGVSNGRKFKEYRFRNMGKARLEQGGRSLETLHWQGVHPRDGALDVWLDTARSALPVRIRTVDQKDRLLEMRLVESGRAAN